MLLPSVFLLAATSLVLADNDNEGKHGGNGKTLIKSFDNLVAFGDSYTDENRLNFFASHNDTGPPPGTLLPPSNSTAGGGTTWARFVAESTGATLFDYAVSGAVCDNNIIFRLLASLNGPFPDVVYEAGAFVADTKFVNATTHTNTLFKNRQADNTVYSMWIGTNDLGVNAFLTDSSLHETTIPDYMDCVFDRIDTIFKQGARFFVMMNTAPLQLSPLYGPAGVPGTAIVSQYWPNKNAQNISEVSGKMKEYTKLTNALYASRTPFELLVNKRYPGAQFAVFDINSLLTDVYNNPAKFFTAPFNVTGPFHQCDATGTVCVNQPGTLNQFMWFDDLHPSQRTDQIIADEFLKVVKGTSSYATLWSG